MNAKTVYQIAKVLPKEEQKQLLNMLKKNLFTIPKTRNKSKTVLEEEDATRYLLTHVFNSKS